MLWRKGRREEKRKKGQMVQIDNRQRGGQFKPNYSNNHFKCKNGLYRPIKKLSLSDWNIKAISNYIYCYKKAFEYKDINRLKVKGWVNIYHVNTNQNKVG